MAFSYEAHGMMTVLGGLPAQSETLSWLNSTFFIANAPNKGMYHVTLKKGNATLDSKTVKANDLDTSALFKYTTGTEGDNPTTGVLVNWILDAATNYTVIIEYSGKLPAATAMAPLNVTGNGHATFVFTGKGDGSAPS